MKNRKKIAIIGSGISGLSTSYFLQDECEINLYEKDNRLGGHSRTITINAENDNKTDVTPVRDKGYLNI